MRSEKRSFLSQTVTKLRLAAKKVSKFSKVVKTEQATERWLFCRLTYKERYFKISYRTIKE